MKLTESLRISWRAIAGHKLRSALTTLGIIIGIGAVVVFLVMGSGFMADVEADIDEDPEPVLTVQSEGGADTGFGFQIDTSPQFTDHDVEQLSEIDGVEYVSPDGWLSGVQLATETEQFTGSLNARATDPARFDDDKLEGERFEADHEAIVNEAVLEALPGLERGENLTVSYEGGSQTEFTVSGVVEDGEGWNAQPTVYVPIDPHYTIQVDTHRDTTERAYGLLEIGTEDIDVRDDVQDAAQAYLSENSGAAELKQDGYELRVLTGEDQLERFEDIIDQITVFVTAIAGIALVVGAIGIGNIMIVSVTERTRQIGIMKAVGATRRDIAHLFVTESLVLGGVGALLGVIAGLGIGWLAITLAGWQMVYPIGGILFAVVIGVAVGVIAGLYPAWRAAKVDPIEALRQE